MKKILLGMLLPVLTLVLVTSCEKDMDSNPTFHENTTGFVLNMPANAANNVLDLLTTDQLTFTTSQPDYGGIPLSTNYDVEISLKISVWKNLCTKLWQARLLLPLKYRVVD